MPSVYLLSEDDFDDQVYAYLVESLLGAQVDVVPFRLRRGGGLGEVRRKLPLLLQAIRRGGQPEDTFFLVALDNDRAQEHPAHHPRPHTIGGSCRFCGLIDAIHEALPDGWLIPGAVAVPVQMIESWLLLMCDPTKNEATLPVCAKREQAVARRVYGPGPPPQLKDLFDEEREKAAAADRTLRRPSAEDFALRCILNLDADDLAARAPSFKLFRDQILRWKSP